MNQSGRTSSSIALQERFEIYREVYCTKTEDLNVRTSTHKFAFAITTIFDEKNAADITAYYNFYVECMSR
jgi:hypothetical protein